MKMCCINDINFFIILPHAKYYSYLEFFLTTIQVTRISAQMIILWGEREIHAEQPELEVIHHQQYLTARL